jgi:cellulose synthase/poly-beta-1,6-N-acetylglucosamine synthase-like glycosyltransferase
MLTFIALIVCFSSFTVLLFYILFFRFRIAFYKRKEIFNQYIKPIPISVVICAKNEEENLKNHLPLFLSQQYHEFEVVVVDDGSTDETYYVLKAMQQEHPNLQIIRLNENVNFFSGKKFPLSIGIRSAKYNNLLLTDADCCPASPHWISMMAGAFSEKNNIVLGYGQYRRKKGLLNLMIRFETLYTAMQYFGFALANMPYMGVGRNLAYSKKLFNEQKGFSKHYNLVSGDDDLFVNAAATNKNTSCVIHPDAFTLSNPHTSFRRWWKQKRRHLTTGAFYKKKHKLLLALYPLALIVFYASGVVAIFEKNNFYFVLSLFILKAVLNSIVYKKLTEKFAEKKLFIFSLFFETILILIYGIIFTTNIFAKQGKWK